MAEGFARAYGGGDLYVESAGTKPKGIHPYTRWAMNEVGIDTSAQTSKVLDPERMGSFDYVITLCGDARDHCPSVDGRHWEIPDPAAARGGPSDIIRTFRFVRNLIEKQVKQLLSEILQVSKV